MLVENSAILYTEAKGNKHEPGWELDVMPRNKYILSRKWISFYRWLWRGLSNFWIIFVVGIVVNIFSTWLTTPEDFNGTPLVWLFQNLVIVVPVCVGLFVLTVVSWVLAHATPATSARKNQTDPLVFSPVPPVHSEKETLHLPLCNIPYQRNSYFTGRGDLFRHIQESFQQSNVRPMVLAISGLGGIGKTQLAVEYAYRKMQQYEAIFWFVADTRESLFASYAEIAQMTHVAKINEEDQKAIVQAVKGWLHTHPNWLLVFDNVHDTALIREFLPTTGDGHILFTTRAHTLGKLAQMVHLDVLAEEQGALLLLRRSGLLGAQDQLSKADPLEQQAARELCQEMGCLPLALNQAGAYLEETKCEVGYFLELYRSQQIRLLNVRDEMEHDYPESVMTTWLISLEKVAARNVMAVQLLQVCALLAADGIPEEIFMKGASSLGGEFAKHEQDTLAFNEAIKTGLAYSLIRRNTETHTLSMHRLVQAVIRDGLSEELLGEWQTRVGDVLNELFPRPNYAHWDECERLLPHALKVTTWYGQEKVAPLAVAGLLDKLASYHYQRIRYEEVEALYRQALVIKGQHLVENSVEFATSYNGLAILYARLRKYGEAEEFYKKALNMREQALGTEHEDVTYTLNGLATLYAKQRKYVEAEALYKRVLQTREQALGDEHEEVAYPLNGLAMIYNEQERYDEAEPLYRRALALREKGLGEEHPELTYPLYGLATVYTQRQHYVEAEKFYQRALKISETTLGMDHPQTRMLQKKYKGLMRVMGKVKEEKAV